MPAPHAHHKPGRTPPHASQVVIAGYDWLTVPSDNVFKIIPFKFQHINTIPERLATCIPAASFQPEGHQPAASRIQYPCWLPRAPHPLHQPAFPFLGE